MARPNRKDCGRLAWPLPPARPAAKTTGLPRNEPLRAMAFRSVKSAGISLNGEILIARLGTPRARFRMDALDHNTLRPVTIGGNFGMTLLGTAAGWVRDGAMLIGHRFGASGLLRRVLTNSARQGLNVRLAPKATEILSHRETTRWANKRSLHTQQTASLNHMLGARNKVWQSFPHLLGSKSRTRTARSFINLSRTALV
jgi:hypothetical protein